MLDKTLDKKFDKNSHRRIAEERNKRESATKLNANIATNLHGEVKLVRPIEKSSIKTKTSRMHN